jgi:TonB family protein
MPDAARIAQAQALEVPIILQGAKDADESGKRELFKENATTVLVFENGAVMHLRVKLAVGQTVFIHNTQNGKEVICKVLEAPEQGEMGLTDLEFTTAVPNFWDANAPTEVPQNNGESQNSAEADASSKSHVPTGSPADDPLAMMLQTASKIDVPSMTKPGTESGMPLREELMAAHEMAPDASAATVPVPDFEPARVADAAPASAGERPASAAEPTGEQIDAALRQMSGATAPAEGAEADHSQDDKHIAALMERDARLAKFAAFKEKQAEKVQRDAAAKEAGKGQGKEGVGEPKEADVASSPKKLPMQMSMVEQLTTGKNATYLMIAMGVLIAVAAGFIWHAMLGAFQHPIDTFVALSPVQPSPPPAPPATAPAAAAAAQPTAAPVAPVAKKSPQRARAVDVARADNSDPGDSGDGSSTRHGRGAESRVGAMVPARVLSQPQPTLPPWAVDVQVDGVVTMDVTIDENGNVASTKILSGPRPLQREAERAIGLWQFEPAEINGKPTSSHLTLSVQFLPPPPPKRFP